jgi:hypothetical protein
MLSPLQIALFAYRRPDHLDRALKSLSNNINSNIVDLKIICDGPKTNSLNEKKNINEVRTVASSWESCKKFNNVRCIFKESNDGLAVSIIRGATDIINNYGHVIVLEDDLETSPYFINYMRDGLSCYENDKNVASIHAYSYPINNVEKRSYFLRGAGSWGWGTWKRAWDCLETNGDKLRRIITSLNETNEFDFYGTRNMMEMLCDQISGRNDSWAILWHASTFIKKMYTLHPGTSLVKNVGFDGSGTHCKVKSNDFDVTLSERPESVIRQGIEEDVELMSELLKYFNKIKNKRRFPGIRKLLRQLRKFTVGRLL